MRGLCDKPQTVHQILRAAVRHRQNLFVERLGPPVPRRRSQPMLRKRGELPSGAAGSRPRNARHPCGDKPRENAAENPPAAQHSKQALGFACRPEKVRKSPDLRGRKSAYDAHPDVQNQKHPGRLIKVDRPPESADSHDIEAKAPKKQVPEARPAVPGEYRERQQSQ